jgi:hypothetical protein
MQYQGTVPSKRDNRKVTHCQIELTLALILGCQLTWVGDN